MANFFDDGDDEGQEASLSKIGSSTLQKVSQNEYRLPSISKQEYFESLDAAVPEYRNVSLDDREKEIVKRHLKGLSTGTAAAVPLYCAGRDRCPFSSNCVLASLGREPVGDRCFVEAQLLNEFSKRYFEEFNVDPNSMVEINYIRELAKLDIYEMRLHYVLARPENSEMVIEQVVNITENGETITRLETTPYFNQLERISNRRSKIVKLMVGDRQEKYKQQAALKLQSDSDMSVLQSQMRDRLLEMQRTMEGHFQEMADGTSTLEEKKETSVKQILSPDDILALEDSNGGEED